MGWLFIGIFFMFSFSVAIEYFFRILSLSNGISISIRLSLITFEVVFPCKLQKIHLSFGKISQFVKLGCFRSIR